MKKIRIKAILTDKAFYKTMLFLAIPITMQSAIQMSLGIIDQLMIGKLGENAIAAVALGFRIPFILIFAQMGIASAASIFIAQYWGNKDFSRFGQIMGIAFISGSIITLCFNICSYFFPTYILRLFTDNALVVTLGSSYLKILSFGFFPLLIVLIYSAALRSTEQVTLPLYAGLLAVILNTILNYPLIFGKFGFPELGTEGAAIATLISKIIEAVFLITMIYSKKYPAAVPLISMFQIPKEFSKKFILMTVPLVITELSWVVGDTVFTAIYSHIGIAEFAAISMTFPIQGFSVGIFTGLSTAAAVMIGNILGTNNKEKAYDYAKKIIAVGFIATVICGLLVMSISQLYVKAFNVSPEIKDYAFKILLVFSMIIWIKVLNMTVGGGILRSGGETKYIMYINIFGMWVIGIPLGLISAFLLELPIYWVYFVISLEELVRLGLCLHRTRSKKWLISLTTEETTAGLVEPGIESGCPHCNTLQGP